MRGNHIKATMHHDAGAYAQCSYCQRYSDNPNSLGDRRFACQCGEFYGWSGSFKPPIESSKWSDTETIPSEYVNGSSTKEKS